MNIVSEVTLNESIQSSNKEITFIIGMVNKIYKDWQKIGRRKNAMDLTTSTVNKLSNIHPATLPKIHEATLIKITILIIRCFDLPIWKEVSSKEKIYKKLYPLLNILQTYNPNTGSGGTLRDVIMTRLSASISYSRQSNVMVAYEPIISSSYISYMFDNKDKPKKIYKMKSLSLPSEFSTLLNILTINQEKVEKKADN